MYIMSRQAHFIEVEVDTETGEIIVTNVVCVNDVGHLFSRRGAEAQQYGGAIMGLGRSATEEKVYCPRTGVGLNFDNIGYHIGTMNDYPEVKCILNESHLGYSSYGACGVGEASAASMSGITAGAFLQCHRQMGSRLSADPATGAKSPRQDLKQRHGLHGFSRKNLARRASFGLSGSLTFVFQFRNSCWP